MKLNLKIFQIIYKCSGECFSPVYVDMCCKCPRMLLMLIRGIISVSCCPACLSSAHLPPSPGLVGLQVVYVDGVHTDLRKARFTRRLPAMVGPTSASTRSERAKHVPEKVIIPRIIRSLRAALHHSWGWWKHVIVRTKSECRRHSDNLIF